MAKKTTLTVITPDGTFTRTTTRTYTHLVVVGPVMAHVLESQRQHSLSSAQSLLAKYERTVATGWCQDARPGVGGMWDRECCAAHLADGSYLRWIDDCKQRIADMTAQGTITDDCGPVHEVGWCGRLDLAQTLAKQHVGYYRWVRIYDRQGTLIASW